MAPQRLASPVRRFVDRRVSAEIARAGYQPTSEVGPDDVVIVGSDHDATEWFRFVLAGAIFGVDVTMAPATAVSYLTPDLETEAVYHRYDPRMFFVWHALPRPEFRRVISLVRDGEAADGWAANPHGADVITIRCEDLLSNGVNELERLCVFLDVERDREMLEAALGNARQPFVSRPSIAGSEA